MFKFAETNFEFGLQYFAIYLGYVLFAEMNFEFELQYFAIYLGYILFAEMNFEFELLYFVIFRLFMFNLQRRTLSLHHTTITIWSCSESQAKL